MVMGLLAQECEVQSKQKMNFPWRYTALSVSARLNERGERNCCIVRFPVLIEGVIFFELLSSGKCFFSVQVMEPNSLPLLDRVPNLLY